MSKVFSAVLLTSLGLFTHGASADAVLDWNDVTLAEVTASGQLPPDGARTMALVHVAVFDALNAIDRRYEPVALSERGPEGASTDAAVASASYTVLAALFPSREPRLAESYAAALARVPDRDAKHAGIELGVRAAHACLELRAGDGTGAPNRYAPETSAGVYVPTSLPVSSEWPDVEPWSMQSGAQFRPAPPPKLTSDVWTRDFAEVERLGAKDSAQRTAAQTEDARFWSITGPAAWNPVVRSLASSRQMSPVDRARLFALANVAAMDSFVAVFDAKYAYGFWRPITAIRRADLDGNDATAAAPEWLPLLETPLHPEYPCAHCISAAAVGTVLEAELGTGEVPPISMTSAAVPGVVHRWTRIGDYVKEVNDARIFAGVHYRNSTEVGETMGRSIARQAVATLMRRAD
ncbi:MAG TPA: PA-phosphatase [Gammaproteobacteria bacterium]|nr:PA-phosphatase [Gammaproteobacteria bacterium]